MLQKHVILIVSAVTCVAAVWYVRMQNPTFQYAPFLTTCVIAATIYVYWKTNNPTKKCVSDSSINSNSCELDSDCNAPNGQCWKNADGVCGCVCNNGYSGPNCKTQGIPWNSPNCMGPNKQWPARKDKNGMCVCPPGHWQSGTDGTYGYVQCLQCAGNYGPLAGDAPCSYQWGQQTMLSNTCITNNNSNEESWCQEFGWAVQNPPKGQTGNIVALEQCGTGAPNAPNSCRCAEPSGRAVCQVNGWVASNGSNATCSTDNVPRKCSSYTCK